MSKQLKSATSVLLPLSVKRAAQRQAAAEGITLAAWLRRLAIHATRTKAA